MNHLSAMINSNLDNFVNGEIGAHRRILSPLSNDICFVGLLTVHGQAIFVAEDGDCMQRQLVCCSEDANGDLATIGH
jgi:hypothetical protein